jgi:restriction endonuclease
MDESPLFKEFERLKKLRNAQRRGYEFQSFVGSMLGARHFKVENKPRAARPRQVDLFASRGELIYLIETKWRQDKANIDDIDSLYTRLDAMPSHVTGLLASYAGFTQEGLDRVREKSNRPVLLVTGRELQRSLEWDGDFVGLLRRKANSLLVHREVLVDTEFRRSRRAVQKRTQPGELPLSNRLFVFPDGQRSKWLQCGGSFGEFTFVPELPDIDCVPASGLGVTLDIRLPVQEQTDLFSLIHQLARMGWVTAKGCWSIQQATTNWHGFGADALVEALQTWESRYEGLETHHTEEVCYFDESEDGFYTLIAAISADRRRIVWKIELSFQLRGIPLDPSPFRELCAHFDLSDPVYFRPRNNESVIRGRPARTAKWPVVTPLAYVVLLEDRLPGDEEWVVGIVTANPFGESRPRSKRIPKWVPSTVEESEYLICGLRSWHVLEHRKSVYELWEFESAWTSGAQVVHALADWRDEPENDEMRAVTVEMGRAAPGGEDA